MAVLDLPPTRPRRARPAQTQENDIYVRARARMSAALLDKETKQRYQQEFANNALVFTRTRGISKCPFCGEVRSGYDTYEQDGLGKFICFKCVEDSDELNAASDADTYAATVRLGPDSDTGSQADSSWDDSTPVNRFEEIRDMQHDIALLKARVDTLQSSQNINDLFNSLKPKIAEEIRDGVAAAISAEMDKNAPTQVHWPDKLSAVDEGEYGTDEVGFPDPDDSYSLQAEVTELWGHMKAMHADFDIMKRYLLDQALVMKTQNDVVQDLIKFKDDYRAKKDRPFRQRFFGLSANAADLPALLARLDAS